jgi:hypothetical protein
MLRNPDIAAKKAMTCNTSGSGVSVAVACKKQHFPIHFKELRDVIAARVNIRGNSLIVFNTQTHFSVIMMQHHFGSTASQSAIR